MALRLRRAGLVLLGALAASNPARAACDLVTTLPLRDVDGFLLVPADIGGIAVSLVVDTGSDAGLIAGPIVRALGLAPGGTAFATLSGTGGDGRDVPVATVPRLVLGRLALDHLPMPVGTLPAAPRVDPPVAGLIGADLLSQFALLIDVPAGRLTLLSDAGGCGASVLGSPPADTIPLQASGDRRVLVALLDGRPVTALVDTGARSRIVARRTALALGVAASLLDGEPGGVTAGVDLRDALYHWHRFHSLRIGRETARDPVLTVTSLPSPGPDMLLGSDWFARHRVLLSYRGDRLFVQDAPPR